MKATTLLEHQHRNLQELCKAVEYGSAGMRASLLPQLASDLVAHIAVEEKVFYPAASEALHEDAWLRVCGDLRVSTRASLHRALEASPEGEDFTRAIGELRGLLHRHAEQEEDLLFPRMERALDPATMRSLGLSMLALYDVAVETAYSEE